MRYIPVTPSRTIRSRQPWLARTGGLLLLGLSCLVSCQTDPATSSAPRTLEVSQPANSLAQLHFDKRYADSIRLGPPYSARTRRQMAIQDQLARLVMVEQELILVGQQDAAGLMAGQDSVHEYVGGRLVGHFVTPAAQLADIHRQLDSLKVLEHIPLTPYLPLKP